jgi:hypothetical protein
VPRRPEGPEQAPKNLAQKSTSLKELGSRELAPEVGGAGRTYERKLTPKRKADKQAKADKQTLITSESWISKAASVGIRDREIQTSKVQTVNDQPFGAHLRNGRAHDVEVCHIAGDRRGEAFGAARLAEGS